MLDTLFNIVPVVMLLYWLLWLAGLKLPGVGDRAFKGWLYSDNDEPRRTSRHNYG